MKQIAALTIALGLCVTPAFAQDDNETDVQDGFSLMEEGAKMLMRGLMSEIEPTLEELRGSLAEMGPVFGEFMRELGPDFVELLGDVDDLRNYQAPEFLPNGDIIIRRKPDAPVWEPNDAPDGISL